MPDKEKSFEENLTELEEVVAKLEQGEVPLEEAIRLFQEGMRLAKFCAERLSTVEKEIKKLVAENDKFKLESFGPADE